MRKRIARFAAGVVLGTLVVVVVSILLVQAAKDVVQLAGL
jgi:hypothetical protein